MIEALDIGDIYSYNQKRFFMVLALLDNNDLIRCVELSTFEIYNIAIYSLKVHYAKI